MDAGGPDERLALFEGVPDAGPQFGGGLPGQSERLVADGQLDRAVAGVVARYGSGQNLVATEERDQEQL